MAAESWDLATLIIQSRADATWGQDKPVFCHLTASESSLPLASLLPPTEFLQSPNSLNIFLFLCQETPVPERTQPSYFTGWQLRGSVLIRSLVPNLGFSKSQVGLYELLTMFEKSGGNCSRSSKSAQSNEDSHPLALLAWFCPQRRDGGCTWLMERARVKLCSPPSSSLA